MPFPAKYWGYCGKPDCREKFEVGDLIEWSDEIHGYQHADCPEPVEEPAPEVCQKCWQAKAKNGACGCA